MSLPQQQKTDGERQKVAGRTDRLPINRQAAMIIKRPSDWSKYPPQVVTPPNPLQAPLDTALADLKIERNDKARLADLVGEMRGKIRQSAEMILTLEKQLTKLSNELAGCRQEIASNKRLISMLKGSSR